MNKKLILCLLTVIIAGILVFPASIHAQNEQVGLTSADIESYIAGKNIAGAVMKSYGPDYTEAYNVGWQSVSEIFGLEGSFLTLGEEVIGISSLKTINEYCGEIGLGMALVQLTIDIYQGNYGTAALNFGKNFTNYSIGKWGTSAMKITAVGVGFIDYALNKLGAASIEARVGTWKSAYFNYFERGPEKRNLKQWEEAFSKAESREDIERIIIKHLDTFWVHVTDPREYGDVRTLGPYQALRDPLPDEKTAIRNDYMKERLLPYLTALFNSMARKAKEQAIEKVQDYFKKIAGLLNASFEMRVVVVGPKDRIAGLPIKIGNWEGVTDGSGKYVFKCTLYGYIKGGTPKEVVLTVKSKDGEKELREKVVLRKGGSTVTFQLGGIADVKGIVTNEATKEPVKGAKISIPAAKVSASTNAGGEYLLKDVPNGDYQVGAQHNAYEKKSVPLKVEVPEGEKGKQVVELNIELKPIPPAVQILFPKEGQLVEKLQFNILARVNAGGAGLKKEAVKMVFDGKDVDFKYDESSGDINYATELLKEDVPTKAKHNVTVTAEVTDEKGQKKALSKSVNFTAGIRPVVTELKLNDKYFKEPDKEPMFTGQVYDEHSGPDAGTLMVLFNGNPVQVKYGTINDNSLYFIYSPTPSTAMRGGSNSVVVTIKDKAGIPSQPRSIFFNLPGPEIQLVKPVNIGRVVSGDVFSLALQAKNIGSGPAKSLRGVLYSIERNYATVTQATANYGDIDPGLEVSGTPLYTVKTAQNLGNPQNGEPVYCNFTVRFYQTADPKQFWEDKFSVPIYPGEMQFGTVYVKLIHGTYMAGEWPVHTAYQTVCLSGTGGNFTTTSDANGNATFENIPPGDYTTYVPRWYTYGAKLGEYIKSVTVAAGGTARATLKGSCPYIFTWDGSKYVKDNDVYSVARAQGTEGSPFAFSEATAAKFGYVDYYKVEKKLVAKGGVYPIMLKEVRDEVSHTDMVSLWVVDHPKETKVSCDLNGNVITYGSPKPAISALDKSGKNISSTLATTNNKGWNAYNNDTLDIAFTGLKDRDSAKLVFYWKGFVDGKGSEENAQNPGRPSIRVYVQNTDNNWVETGKIYPRQEWAHSIVDLSRYLNGNGKLTVRLIATSCYRDKYSLVDFVGLDASKDERVTITKLSPAKVIHSARGDVTKEISSSDKQCVDMAPEEQMEISFPYATKDKDTERSFIFVSEGYYNSLSAGDVAVRLGK